MTSYKNNWLVQWTVVGLLLGIGFVLTSVWWLGVVGTACTIYLSLQKSPLKQIVVGGLLAWTTKSALALIWFWSVYPIEWVGIDLGYLQLILIFFWWSTAALWLGFGGVLFVVGCRLLQAHTSLAVTYLSIPFLWLAAEMFGSLIFSLITIGPGGSITTAFSFGYVGYLLAGHNVLIQFAQIGGVYSLGVLLAALGVLFMWMYTIPAYKKYAFGFTILLLVTSFIPIQKTQMANDSYTVAVIDTDFKLDQLRTGEGRDSIQMKIESAVQSALTLEPDYILLPEDSRYFDQQSEVGIVAAQFRFRTDDVETIIVDSGRADDAEKAVVQSFIYNGKENVIDQSHKRYLVPQGEFMPTLYTSALKLFGRAEMIDQFAKTVAFEVGSKTNQDDHAVTSPGVLFCFESVSPWGVRSVISERGTVPFIAHPISHAWFNQPQTLLNQLTSMLQVQAIWNQQYIVSSGNAASSQVFLPTGVVVIPELIDSGDGWQLQVTQIPK
jgi:apolipoprotein N-acyltransferase